jgi:hypothetical protein
MQLTATAFDNKGNAVPNQSFIWSSSNGNATVDVNGLVKAQTALIGGKSGSVQINVK